jgi:hypothetical protein
MLGPYNISAWQERSNRACTTLRACEHTLAAPVLLGMMLKLAALPPLQSLAEGPSTVFWVAERHQSYFQFAAHKKPSNDQKRSSCRDIRRQLTSDGMDSGHQTLNDTEVVMNDLK